MDSPPNKIEASTSPIVCATGQREVWIDPRCLIQRETDTYRETERCEFRGEMGMAGYYVCVCVCADGRQTEKTRTRDNTRGVSVGLTVLLFYRPGYVAARIYTHTSRNRCFFFVASRVRWVPRPTNLRMFLFLFVNNVWTLACRSIPHHC